jgi:hypothetical protein
LFKRASIVVTTLITCVEMARPYCAPSSKAQFPPEMRDRKGEGSPTSLSGSQEIQGSVESTLIFIPCEPESDLVGSVDTVDAASVTTETVDELRMYPIIEREMKRRSA